MKTTSLLAACLTPYIAIAASNGDIDARAVTPANSYAPIAAACPSTPLVRKGNGISAAEADYVKQRKIKTDYAMQLFLIKTKAGFPKLNNYPQAAILSSGGGLRAMLVGAGVVKAFDGREGLETYSTAGLYQCMTYHAGLSGGAWLLSSIASNNYPTISWLYNNLWAKSLETGPFVPGSNDTTAYAQITADVLAKQTAGFNVSVVDPYGREIAYEILQGSNGGVNQHFSDITGYSNYTNHLGPFPIITALGVNERKGQCYPNGNSTQYEFSPLEFGSWDKGIKAFAQTKYLGSALSNGKPASSPAKACITGFDETSYVFGTSSNIFPALSCPDTSLSANLSTAPYDLLPLDARGEMNEVFSLIPNPFYKVKSSRKVAAQKTLTLADGGLASENNPIHPLLYRPDVSVLFVNDNSADTNKNLPNGTELYTTYLRAQTIGLTDRMPVIPPSSVFVAQNLTSRPTVFGCNSTNPSTLTIVWLPNTPYNGFNSGTSTFMLQYSAAQSKGMIDDGAQVASYGQKAGFDTCMGCFLVKKEANKEGKALPSACTACFEEFCYN